MKLEVQGIEEIEITDPSGLCNLPRPALPAPLPAGTFTPGIRILPATTPPRQPITPIFTRADPSSNACREKWEVGGNAIQQAGQNLSGEAPDGD